MAKTKTSYFCQSCGAQSAKWVGKCPVCNEWNTYVEEVVEREETKISSKSFSTKREAKPILLRNVERQSIDRIDTQDSELNRVLGGGIVPGSLILIGGEPGIGKSTLMLQLAIQLQNHKILYVSGEESEQQIKMRAERIAPPGEHCYIFSETNTQNILRQANELQPDLIIVDSVQTLHSSHIESP
ncbi:MAG: AAA family ATPase, partial [Chitinophagales bacterium]|nr:AAA family ATPase [Chitinophagales bacterium]